MAELTGSGYVLLSEYLEQPHLLEPPPCVLPHLAWEGRVSLLSSVEKGGKSTLVGQGVAAMVHATCRDFLDGEAMAASVLWLAMDEPIPDLVRRLARFEAKSGVGIYTRRPTPEQLTADIGDLRPKLLVIDTLTRMALGEVTEGGSRMQWAPLMADISALARTHNLAVLVLHHFTRSGERYSESAEIGASVDQIIDMKVVDGNASARKLDSRGRVTFERLQIDYQDGVGYDVDSGKPIALTTLVLQAVAAHPGIGLRELRECLPGRHSSKDGAIQTLESQGMIQNRRKGNANSYWLGGPKLNV